MNARLWLVLLGGPLLLSCGDKDLPPPPGSTETEGDVDGDGFAADVDDCDDDDASVYPGADELCDGVDNDCDGEIDGEGALDVITWYFDADGDGYGDDDVFLTDCEQPSGYLTEGGDCDDDNIEVSPGIEEACNDIDDDCDNSIDEGAAIGADIWYADEDGDGYGSPDNTQESCFELYGYTSDNTDCDDSDDEINPDGQEICGSGVTDEDCDGLLDEEDDSLDLDSMSTWYPDADSDNYGDESSEGVLSCRNPATDELNYLDDNTDCDDTDSNINPDELESCDEYGVDEDCDGLIDDDDKVDLNTTTMWYPDTDGDGCPDSEKDPGLALCDDPSTEKAQYAAEGSCD